MKKVLVVFMILFMAVTATSFAATDVSFRWEPNTEQDLAGYRVYRSTTSGNYTQGEYLAEIPCGPSEISCAEYVDQNVADGTYFWVVTARDTEGLESMWSNEVTSLLDSTPPAPPQNLSIWQKIIAWLRNLFDSAKLRIG